MTDEPAAIQATFSDFKLIRSRKTCQVVLEIPIEGADAALAALGGIPQPHSDRWVAVARLNGVTKPEPEPKEKRKWDDLKLSMQAGVRCEEEAFRQYLKEQHSWDAVNAEVAASAVRYMTGVDSRAGLNDNPVAAERWRNLDRSYQAWLRVADEVAPRL